MQRKGRVRHGQSHTDCLEEKGWDIGYQDWGVGGGGVLLKQVRKRAKAKRADQRGGKAGEKKACQPVRCFWAMLPLPLLHLISFSLSSEGQICSGVDFVKDKSREKENGSYT